jgi:hypothetical protein
LPCSSSLGFRMNPPWGIFVTARFGDCLSATQQA